MGLFRHRPAISLVVTLSCWLFAAPAWSEPDASCAASLAVDAVDEDSLQLRQELVNGLLNEIPAASCAGASLRLERDGETLRVFLEQGEQVISREVTSVERAGMWVEAWLAPPSADSLSLSGDAALETNSAQQDLSSPAR